MNHSKQTPKTFCTTREAAKLLSVSLRTAQLWTESGLLEAWKTEGGHRRIYRESVEKLLAKTPVVESAAITRTHHPNDTKSRRITDRQEQGNRFEPINILVVEDDSALRRLYEIKFREWHLPINVTTVDDGYEALIRIGRTKPDMLVADLNMRGMDGFHMLYVIRTMPEFADINIVVVSGLNVDEIAKRGDIPDNIPIFPKPIPFDQLRNIAVQLIENRMKLLSQEVV